MQRTLSSEEIYYIANEYIFYSDIAILVIGLLNNIFIILILKKVRAFRSNQSAFYLIIESAANIGLLLVTFPSDIASYIIGKWLTSLSAEWCKLRQAISQIFGLSSIFTICLLTFDQYLATNYRYTLRQMSTLKLAHRLTFIIICFSTFHSAIFFVFVELHESNGCTVYNLIVKKYLSYFYYSVLSSSLPIIITLSFSILSYYNVYRIVRRQIPVFRRRLNQQMTIMVLARVVSLISLGLPFILFQLYQLNRSPITTDARYAAILSLVSSICNSLLYFNFSINFCIFLLVSKRFRNQVKYFLIKCIDGLRLNSTHRNQVAPDIELHNHSSAAST